MLEAAERHGLSFPPLAPETLAKLGEVLGVGTSLGNPLDAGFAALSSAEAYFKCIDLLRADPNIDVLLVQEELPPRRAHQQQGRQPAAGRPHGRRRHGPAGRGHLDDLLHVHRAHRASSARNCRTCRCCRRSTRRSRRPAPPAATARCARWRPSAPAEAARAPSRTSRRCCKRRTQGAPTDSRSCTRRTSKELLRAYGIRTPNETIALQRRHRGDGGQGHRLSGGAEAARRRGAAQVRHRRRHAQHPQRQRAAHGLYAGSRRISPRRAPAPSSNR